MKVCDMYRCKRVALGLTQAELAKIVGVSTNTIVNFESGKKMSEGVFNDIRNAVEGYFRALDKDEYFERRIFEGIYSLKYQDSVEKIKTLNHMTIHIAKLVTDLVNDLDNE